ncbi:hypothetical protein [Brevundimonas nasdae]|uniref:hypothetical protein n=1 Tax=Brevundimonas nasdae TaxID=172043 RepID=UPI00289F9615|nr:hypothetical protein [Brevundimonas nasdae]
MTDPITAARRDYLLEQISNFEAAQYHLRSHSSAGRRTVDALYEELHALDSVATQARLVEAQDRVAEAQREATAVQRSELARQEEARSENEANTFWSRRYLTSLSVAHGAGAFAAISAMLRSPTPIATDLQLERIVLSFGFGLLTSGLTPLAHIFAPKGPKFYKTREHIIAVFAAASTLAFLLGVWTTLDVARATYADNSSHRIEASSSPP